MGICPQKAEGLNTNGSGKKMENCDTRFRSRFTQRFLRIAVIVLVYLFVPLLSPASSSPREDNASLIFRKTGGFQNTRVYIAKKGDQLAVILRSQLGTSKIPPELIRRLNPEIRDLNRIYPGQRILLPVLERAAQPAPPNKKPGKTEPTPATYKIQEGDSISRIILAELNTDPDDVLPTYRLILWLNPQITDPNNLQAGGSLNLPPRPAPTKPSPPPPPLGHGSSHGTNPG